MGSTTKFAIYYREVKSRLYKGEADEKLLIRCHVDRNKDLWKDPPALRKIFMGLAYGSMPTEQMRFLVGRGRPTPQ